MLKISQQMPGHIRPRGGWQGGSVAPWLSAQALGLSRPPLAQSTSLGLLIYRGAWMFVVRSK